MTEAVAVAAKQYIRVGERQVELPPGVTVADWALERLRVQNPSIRSYLGCIRLLEGVLESNYAILHCSPRRLLNIWRKVREVCLLMRSELEPTLAAPSVIPALETARRNAFYSIKVLSTTVLQDIEAYPTKIPSEALPAIRRLLCLSIGKIYSFLRDTFGEVVANDPRSSHDSDYFLSRRFPQEIEEAEWLYATVDRLSRDLRGLGNLWQDQLNEVITVLKTERRLPTEASWGKAVSFLELSVDDLTTKLREVLALPGIRYDEMEPLDHYAFNIPHLCQTVVGVYTLGLTTVESLKTGRVTTLEERLQRVEDLQKCHASFSRRMLDLLEQISRSIQDLTAYIPLWVDNIESRRALMLTKSRARSGEGAGGRTLRFQ